MKNIIITGSSKGLGLALSVFFLKKGCTVTLSGRRAGLNLKVEEWLKEYKNQYQYVSCDVRNKDELASLFDRGVEKFGDIDIFINNAGVNTPFQYVHKTNPDQIKTVIETNLLGMINGTVIATQKMVEQGHGYIYNMEGLGSNGMIQEKTVIYGTTKSALTYFTKGVAKELKGTEVKIGRLSPGMMKTDFILKAPESDDNAVANSHQFKYFFNVLGDHPFVVADYLVKKILRNTKNDAHIQWLTPAKITKRFLISPFYQRNLI